MAEPGAREAGPFVIVAGLPGAGKTTLARELGRRLPATYLSSDAVRRGLALGGRYDRESIARVYDELIRRASVAASCGAVVVDATFASRRFRDAAVLSATEAGAPLVLLIVRADEATTLARVARSRDDSEAGPAAYALLRGAFDPVTLPHLALDSSAAPSEALAEAALDYVRKTAPPSTAAVARGGTAG